MILIADSGSTKTDWVLWIPKTNEVFKYKTKGLNPYFTKSSEITEEMREHFASDDLIQLKEIFFYGSGCGSIDSKSIVFEGLTNACKNAKIHIEHDLMASARSLLGNEKGIACILGTGSNACLYDGKVIIGEAVSFGYIMGDEGSGNHIGRMLLKAIFNGKAPKELVMDFNDKYPHLDLSRLLDQLYNLPNPNRFLASFSPFVLSNQDKKFVRALIESSFNQFLDEFVVDLSMDKSLPVSFQGSIAWSYKAILKKVLGDRGFKMGNIIKQPIDTLLEFHKNNKI
ncbi:MULTISPECIES: N-acetylglucosamine kinase [unclassified Lentimicrobium]|uniref:N-acetylglucosamine kinase n=1 Tax=unclassified Lentimicrobium TaxID=2677434 RepID=UPI00155535ED|nr:MULTISPECIES: N-acetylglucosamine kinase [unclassified Lentimicrobium]NPD45026.1 N-acetylglucosamine kinase [Lentimicrobium sp. S6]NPD86048.1 N-acetylglucosamine kinase [Lentimicrobium sp. L6]